MNTQNRVSLNHARKAIVPVLVTALLAGGAGLVAARVVDQPVASSVPTIINSARPGFGDLVQAVSPAVVNISVTTSASGEVVEGLSRLPRDIPMPEAFRRFFEQFEGHGGAPGADAPERRGLGSGFVVSAEGHVVTNHHVVDEASKITVTLNDGTQLPATLVGSDPKTDLAVLKVEPEKPLAFVRFGDSDGARAGDWILAIGNPFGLGGTVTTGIISARGRDLNSGPFDDFIQVDAPINRGNSGGPLFDLEGRVIGVNSAIYSPNGGNVGIGFAIPANQAQPVVEQLIAEGHIDRGWLGVRIQAVNEDMAAALGLDETKGALVAAVEEDSPARRAGLKPGDVILDVDGQPIDTLRDLTRYVAGHKPGAEVAMTLWRERATTTVDVTLGESAEQIARVAPQETSPAKARLGVSVAPLDGDIRDQLGLGREARGVVVAGVDPQGNAARKGIRRGDIITQVDQQPVDGPRALIDALDEAQSAGRDQVLVLLLRDGAPRFVAVDIS
ncbi:MAG: DegQ family serine endoprotease [Gammaproteobacteria bacterium]